MRSLGRLGDLRTTAAWLRRHRVAILKGGWSRERTISLKTGAAVENSFKRMNIPYYSLDVRPPIVHQLKTKKIEFCFIALHGEFGEDGALQAILDLMRLPYTGSGTLGSALAMDKGLSKRRFDAARIPTPPWLPISQAEFRRNQKGTLLRIRSFMKKSPIFIKPLDQGSALGAQRVDNRVGISKALKNCFRYSTDALIEKFISGRELTVGILGDKILPITEIIPKHHFYDYYSKYAAGGSQHVTPAELPKDLTQRIKIWAMKAFQTLDCQVYGRVDFLLSRANLPYVLEVNTIPGMTPTSLLPEAAQSVGISFDQLVLRICELSLRARKKEHE